MGSIVSDKKINPEKCLCKILEIIAESRDLESTVQTMIELLPSCFKYPDNTCVRLQIGRKTFKTSNFKVTPWMIECSTENKKTISINVCILEGKNEEKEELFTESEKCVLNAVCNSLKTLQEKEHYKSMFHESNEKFSAFMDNALDGVVVLDFKGNILLLNKAILRMFDADESDLSKTHNILDYLCEEYKIKAIKDQLNVIRGKGGYLSTYKVRSKKGREFWIEGLGTKITYKGRIANIVVIRDISERKAAEDKLKDYRYKIDKIIKERTSDLLTINRKLKEDLEIKHFMDDPMRYLESIGVMIIVLDMDGHVSFINHKGCEMLEYNEMAVVGQDWVEVFVPDDHRNYVREIFMRSLEGSQLEKYESPVLKYNGELRLISWTNMPLMDDRNNITGIVTTGEDITDIRHSQEELQKYIADLRDNNEFKALFIDILRHDLLNPAGIIKGYSEILMENTDEDNASMARQIYKQNEKLIHVINTASMFGKLESTDAISFEEMDLLTLLKEVASGFEPLLEEKAMLIEYPLDDEYLADVNILIEEAFSNLLSNAIKFSPHGSKIVLDITDDGPSWKITFTDSGIGVSDEHKEDIFARWRRFSAAGTKGSGLGLAIVKKIIELHNGQIGIYDNPSAPGSVFWIRIWKKQ